MVQNEFIREKVKNTLIRAASSYREDQLEAYRNALVTETVPRAKWVLKNLIENAAVAEKSKSPLCDDTGIPHLFLEMGKGKELSREMLDCIYKGVEDGLRELPGRPMAIMGDDIQRLEQSGGLDTDPAGMFPAPLMLIQSEGDETRLHILMQGGGPEIRGKTYRVFHQHSIKVIVDEIVSWALAEVGKLGCTPCTPAIGIGRSHFEASSLMLQAMAYGKFNIQSDTEREITSRINQSNVGPLGLNGNTTALATFLKVGPQRASGVRIVSLRLCCCVEPRVASVML